MDESERLFADLEFPDSQPSLEATTNGLPAPYYEDEKNGIWLYHGDCLQLLGGIEPGSVDVVITSPPYNLGNTTGGGFPSLGHYDPESGYGDSRGGGGKWRRAPEKGGLSEGYGVHDDNMPHDKYVEWQKSVLLAAWRTLADNGAIYYNHKPRVLGGRCVTPLEYIPNLPIRQIVIWARAGGINFSPAFYLPTHEWIVVIAKDAFRLRSKGASGVGDVWRITQEIDTEHPAPFPVELPMTILETINASVVLDPFSGSATVGVACLRNGRKYLGFETHEPYCEIAARRLEREAERFPLFEEEKQNGRKQLILPGAENPCHD